MAQTWYVVSFLVLTGLCLFPGGNAFGRFNLTVGPIENETGRFIVQRDPANPREGDYKHCRYCPMKALTDSSNLYMQDILCSKNYNTKRIESLMTDYERANDKYAICNVGDLPVCHNPLPKDKMGSNLYWYCDKGYSLENYTVYFSCALICNVTSKVHTEYYCNEQFEWQLMDHDKQPCEYPPSTRPVPRVLEENNTLQVIAGAGGAVGAIVVLILIGFCIWRRRKHSSGSLLSIEVPNPQRPGAVPYTDEPLPKEQNDPSPGQSLQSRTNSNTSLPSSTSVRSDTDDDEDTDVKQPLLYNDSKIKILMKLKGYDRLVSCEENAFSIFEGADVILSTVPKPETLKTFEIYRRDRKQFKGIKNLQLPFLYTLNNFQSEDAVCYCYRITLLSGTKEVGEFSLHLNTLNRTENMFPKRPDPLGGETDYQPQATAIQKTYIKNSLNMPSVPHLSLTSLLSKKVNNDSIPTKHSNMSQVKAEIHVGNGLTDNCPDLNLSTFRSHESGVVSSNNHCAGRDMKQYQREEDCVENGPIAIKGYDVSDDGHLNGDAADGRRNSMRQSTSGYASGTHISGLDHFQTLNIQSFEQRMQYPGNETHESVIESERISSNEGIEIIRKEIRAQENKGEAVDLPKVLEIRSRLEDIDEETQGTNSCGNTNMVKLDNTVVDNLGQSNVDNSTQNKTGHSREISKENEPTIGVQAEDRLLGENNLSDSIEDNRCISNEDNMGEFASENIGKQNQVDCYRNGLDENMEESYNEIPSGVRYQPQGQADSAVMSDPGYDDDDDDTVPKAVVTSADQDRVCEGACDTSVNQCNPSAGYRALSPDGEGNICDSDPQPGTSKDSDENNLSIEDLKEPIEQEYNDFIGEHIDDSHSFELPGIMMEDIGGPGETERLDLDSLKSDEEDNV